MSHDLIGRPNWDIWAMAIAHIISRRSIDLDTKVGCVIIDEDHTILSTGYNSPPRGAKDILVPLTRPEKYGWMVHSEEAAIANAAKTGCKLDNSVAYVTSKPCVRCLKILINAGIKRIIYGSTTFSTQEEESSLFEEICNSCNVQILEWERKEKEDQIKEMVKIL